MRYVENGVINKYGNYIFDNTTFDIYSQFIYFDTTGQYLDLLGEYIDETNVDFSYVSYDYNKDYLINIDKLSTSMFKHLNTFQSPRDFTLGVYIDSTLDTSTYLNINNSLNVKVLNFIDNINKYNQMATKYDYYDFGIISLYPFSEFIVIKLHGTDIIVATFLNRWMYKSVVSEHVQYTLDYYALSSKYCYQYSTDASDYNALKLKLFYNKKDYETVNKEGLVISNKLFVQFNGDSTKLYTNVILDSTVASLANKYTFFDLSVDDLVLVNNKYLSRIKGINDTSTYDGTVYRVQSNYCIEFLDFDNTAKLESYMLDDTYYDMTKVLVQQYINIRTIKKLNINNTVYGPSDLATSFFRNKLYIKTVYYSGNQPTSQTSSITTQNGFFKTGILNPPISYSGIYDVTNNSPFSMTMQEGSFKTIKFLLPTEAAIDKTTIGNKEKIYLTFNLDSTENIISFIYNYHLNGIGIQDEASILESMVLRLEDITSIDIVTHVVGLVPLLYDEDWYDLLDDTYYIPSDSYIIFLKPCVYNIIPHFDLNKVTFNNNLNNLLGIHFYSYSLNNPETVDQNNQILKL